MGLSSQHEASSFVVIKVYLPIVLYCTTVLCPAQGPNLDPYLQQTAVGSDMQRSDRRLPRLGMGFVHAKPLPFLAP
jgi:hypothetical protein